MKARKAIRCLLSKRRRNAGRSNLESKGALKDAAQRHTKLMTAQGCFEHRCSGEPDLEGRLSDSGYLPCSCSWGIGENIAWGSGELGTPKAIVKAWMNSPGHRANILDPDFEHIGVGVEAGTPPEPGGSGGTYTTDFGYRR